MSEDFVTQLRLQLRDAAEREARQGRARRAARTAFVPALAGVALAALAAIVLVAGAWLRGPDTQPGDRDALRIVSNTQIAGKGGYMGTGFGSVWIADSSGQLLRVDPRTARVVARIATPVDTPFVAIDADAVWLLGVDSQLIRVDPETNRIVARIDLPVRSRIAGDVAIGSGTMWVLMADELLRIDRQRGAVDRRVDVVRNDLEATTWTWDGTSIYVLGRDGRMDRLDFRTGKRLSSSRPAQDGMMLANTGGRIFFAAPDGVAAVDGATGDTAWRRPLGARVNGAVLGGGDLWVQGTPQGGGRDRLWRVELSSGRVLGSLTLPEFGIFGATAVGDRLWLLTPGGRLQIIAGE